MGLRGPAPTPKKVLENRGSWRAKEGGQEPNFPSGKMSAPSFLSKEARAEWSRQVKALVAAGLLKTVDRAALTVYCEAWAEFAKAAAEVEKLGLLIKTPNGHFAQNPYVSIRSAAASRMMSVAAQFGFTPSARARVRAEPAETSGEDDEIAKLFNPGG